jgi:regulator of sigma D
MNLLIHADPGARSGFIAAWLTNRLSTLAFDSGASIRPQFLKIHKLQDVNILKNFSGTKIRVRPSIESIDLHSLLFLRKNVYEQVPEFTRNEYSLETFTKLTHFSQEIFEWDSELDYSLYDIVLNFADTFDNKYMIDLYKQINNIAPTEQMIDMLLATNDLNKILINKNHACSILKLCLSKEKELGLKEQHRFWSIVDVYNSTPSDQLYNKVSESIVPGNYGIML